MQRAGAGTGLGQWGELRPWAENPEEVSVGWEVGSKLCLRTF